MGSFLLLCLMLKIQPYQSRHHLSAFVLFAPFIALVISECWNRYLIVALSIILLASSSQFLFYCNQRPLLKEKNILNLSRNEAYFISRPFLTKPYIEMAEFLKNQECTDLGFLSALVEKLGNIQSGY